MNKYIITDLEQAETYMRSAIMNALHDIDSGEEEEINLGRNISWNLFYNCLENAGWKVDDSYDEMEYNGWEVDFWSHWISPSGKYVTIEGSLYCGQSYTIICSTSNNF